MATVTLSPTQCKAGDEVIATGDDFLPGVKCTITVLHQASRFSFSSEINSDAGGNVSTTDIADAAVTTLTSSGVNVTDGDTVTIGAVTYRFKNTMAAINDVKIGADAATTLANLKKTINLTGTAGTEFFAGTVIHPTVEALTLTATTLLLAARTGGTAGNSLASTKVAATLTFTGATFSGGSASTGYATLKFIPGTAGAYTVTISDGTNSASALLQVWSRT